MLPACRFHRITYQHFVDVIAPRTFKGPQIGVGGARFDLGQHHAALTFWAARPFDGNQRWFGAHVRLRHVMHPYGEGGSVQHSQSPTIAGVRAVMENMTIILLSAFRH